MPIYEYRCGDCRRRTSVFTRTINGAADAVCEHCGSRKMTRLMSRVSVVRSGGDAFDSFDESAFADVDENDPRAMARMIRKMSGEMGEPLDAEMEADLDRMEAGEMPDDFGASGEDEEFDDVD